MFSILRRLMRPPNLTCLIPSCLITLPAGHSSIKLLKWWASSAWGPVHWSEKLSMNFHRRNWKAGRSTRARNGMTYAFGDKLPHDESRGVEFKEVRGNNPVSAIVNTADEYAVAFLNADGGRILWGVRDSD